MARHLQHIEVQTTWGSIAIECANGTVVACDLPQLDQEPSVEFSVTGCGRDAASLFVKALFEGRQAKRPVIDPPGGTPFQREVWKAIAAIPFGESRSYGELARLIGRPRSFRAVANACGRNPIPLFIPCHRVVGSGGRLGGFSSGLAWKLLLLPRER